MIGLALLGGLLAGCDGARVVSPSPDAVIGALRVPLTVRLPDDWEGSTATVSLDGDDVTDPTGFVKGSWVWPGDHAYVAALDLDGLDAGRHRLKVVFTDDAGRRITVRRRFQVDDSGCRLDYRIVDGDGLPRPGRLLVFDDVDQPVNLWGPDTQLADPMRRDDTVNVASTVIGSGALRLPCEGYRFVATGGVRDGVHDRWVELGDDQALEFSVPRVVDTPGWVAADLHVHSARSGDSFVADGFRYESLVGAGVEVALIADHDQITEPPLATLGVDQHLTLVLGAEGSITEEGIGLDPDEELSSETSLAHFNVYPLTADEPLPRHRAVSVGAYIAAWRERQVLAPFPGFGDDVLVQLNHPRGLEIRRSWGISRQAALFWSAGFPAGTPWSEMSSPLLEGEGDPFDFDVIEIMNRASSQLWVEVRADWFALMNGGHFATGTGNSDTHSIEAEWVGFPVNLVDIGSTSAELDQIDFVHAVADGRVVVSNGPVLTLEVVNQAGELAGPGELLDASDGLVEVTARLQAAAWVPLDELRFIVDGEVVHTERLDLGELTTDAPTDRGTWTLPLVVSGDAWVLVEAGRSLSALHEPVGGLYGLVAPDHAPIGFTNPVRLDGDGDGLCTP